MSVDSKPSFGRENPPAESDSAAAARTAHAAALGLFLVCAAGRAVAYFRAPAGAEWAWLDALLILLATAATLIGQVQRLPLQNVLGAAAIIAVIGGIVQFLGARTGIPFGAFTYTEQTAPGTVAGAPWLMPLVWVVVIFNARGVARLVFRPWRKTHYYGIYIIALTCLLALGFNLGFDPLASRISRYWLWKPSQTALTWFGEPWISPLGWLLTALLILAFTTPFLVNKKPQKSPPYYQPLIVWLAISAVLTAGAAANNLWGLAGFTAIIGTLTLGFAVSGARW